MKDKILIISPDIEFKNYRGIQSVLSYILYSLNKSQRSSYLLTGFYKVGQQKEVLLNNAYSNLFLRHYIQGGKEGYDKMLYDKRVISKPISQKMIFFSLLKSLVSQAEIIVVHKEEVYNLPIIANTDRVVNLPFIYQLIDHAGTKGGIASILIRKYLVSILRKNSISHIICASPVVLPKLPKSIRVTQYVHDLMPLQLTQDPMENNSPGDFAKKIAKVVSRSTDFLCNSQDTEEKFLSIFKDCKTTVVRPGPSFMLDQKSYSEDIDSHVLSKYRVKSKGYFFFVSALEKRKNIEGLIKGYLAAFKVTKKPLVIAGGKGYEFDGIVRFLASLKPIERAHIILTGYIPEAEKTTLLKHASLFIFPSFYEGFGIPVLEAYALDCPVLTTDRGGLKEAAGDAADIIEDPYDPYEIGQRIIRIDRDKDYQNKLIARGRKHLLSFTPDKFADSLISFFDDYAV